MNKSNIFKVIIAALLLFVVVIATVNYGRNQRAKIADTDTARNNLPTVQENKPSESTKPSQSENKPNPSKPAQSQPKPEPAPVVTKPSAPSIVSPTVNAQVPQSSMPATGPVDTLIPTIALGTLSGLYLVSRRRLKASKQALQ